VSIRSEVRSIAGPAGKDALNAPAVPSRIAGARLRELRQRRGLSPKHVAAEMTRAGVPWRPQTVLALEQGQRGLDVDELFALAVVVSVSPIALLTDMSEATTALTTRLEVPTAYALLWLLGEQPLHATTGEWEEDAHPVRLVRQLHDTMWRSTQANRTLLLIEDLAQHGSLDPETAQRRRAVQERELRAALIDLGSTIFELTAHNIPIPRLIDEELIAALARNRGIALNLKRPTKDPGKRQELPQPPTGLDPKPQPSPSAPRRAHRNGEG
jgi:transcriptional regulator with XRE-family HTH domain